MPRFQAANHFLQVHRVVWVVKGQGLGALVQRLEAVLPEKHLWLEGESLDLFLLGRFVYRLLGFWGFLHL